MWIRFLFVWALLFLFASEGYGQAALTVEGTVTDAQTGNALPGANVVVKGTTVGTTTDGSGEYSIRVPSAQDTLSFSFVGYQTKEVAVAGRTEIDVAMEMNVVSGEEVVVVGYGTQRRKSLTGSVSSVETESLTKIPATTASDALVGKVSGVNVRKPDGRPGSGTMIQIRNMGNPLYVIDGIPKDAGQFNNLDYSDIKEITILKDAAAASVYGVRAANGVVVVTTKSGQVGQEPSVNINTYYGVQNVTRFPQPADAATFVRAQAEAAVNQYGETSWTREELEKWQEGTEEGYRGFDWYDYGVMENAPQRYVDISTSGGTENTNYYLSVSRLDENAMFRNFNARGAAFNRTNLQANLDSRVGGNITVGTRLNMRIEERQNPGLPGFDDYWPTLFGTYRQKPTQRPFANDNPDYPNTTDHTTSNFAVLTYDQSGYLESNWRVLHANLNAQYEFPIEGLSAKGIYSYYLADNVQDVFEYTYDTYTYDEDTDTYEVTGGNQNPYRSRDNRKVIEHMARLTLNYDRAFGQHIVGVDAALEQTQRREPYHGFHSVPTTNSISLINYDNVDDLWDGTSRSARRGVVGRLNYEYGDRYFLQVAGRYDGSFRFAPGNRWGLFPSASVGWSIANEPFFENSGLSDVVSTLKLRGSYGQLGDDRIGVSPYAYVRGYNYDAGGAVFANQPVTGLVPRDEPETNISWLVSTMSNVGLDFGFMSDRLTGSVDGFYRLRDGLLARRYDVLVPREVAVSVPRENLNKDAHMGIEGELRYSDAVGGLQYSIGGNATFARKRDVSTYKPRFSNSWNEYRWSIEDRWAYLNWGYQVIGRFQSQEEIDNYPVDTDGRGNVTLLPGDFKYKDVNGDGAIDGLDERPIGYRQGGLPYLNLGINASFSYENFDLSFGFAGGAFNSYERAWELRIPFQNNANSPVYMFEDRWHREDILDPESEWVPGEYPALRKGLGGHSNMRSNDYWVQNVHYIRLENLEFGYSIPQSWSGVIGASNLRFYVQGYNLFSIDNVAQFGIDPEIDSGNGLQYPQMQTINVGLDASF